MHFHDLEDTCGRWRVPCQYLYCKSKVKDESCEDSGCMTRIWRDVLIWSQRFDIDVMVVATMASLLPLPTMIFATLVLISLTLVLPRTRINGGVEGTLWHFSFVVATVVIVDTIFVFAYGTTAPRTPAAATDKGIMPKSMVWLGRGGTPRTHQRGPKKKKKKAVVATSLPLCLQTASPVLPPLLPLGKQRQQQWQHGGSGGSSSSRPVAAAAHYFELPCSLASPCSARGIKFPSFILDMLIPVWKNDTGTKNVTELPQLHMYIVWPQWHFWESQCYCQWIKIPSKCHSNTSGVTNISTDSHVAPVLKLLFLLFQ